MATVIIMNQKIFGSTINDLRIETWFLLVSPRTGLDTEVDWAKRSPTTPVPTGYIHFFDHTYSYYAHITL